METGERRSLAVHSMLVCNRTSRIVHTAAKLSSRCRLHRHLSPSPQRHQRAVDTFAPRHWPYWKIETQNIRSEMLHTVALRQKFIHADYMQVYHKTFNYNEFLVAQHACRYNPLTYCNSRTPLHGPSCSLQRRSCLIVLWPFSPFRASTQHDLPSHLRPHCCLHSSVATALQVYGAC